MTNTQMSDKDFIRLTRASIVTPPPVDADPNTIREYNGRVAYLRRIDGDAIGPYMPSGLFYIFRP